MHTVNTSEIQPLVYATEKYKIDNAYKLGVKHAENDFYQEPLDPFMSTEVHSWATNPYTPCRPSVYYAWLAGFHERYGNLLREIK